MGVGAQIQLLQHLGIPLEEFNGVPALVPLRDPALGQGLNLREGLLHLVAEGMPGVGCGVGLGQLDGGLRRLKHAPVFERGGLHHGTAHGFGQLLDVDDIAVLGYQVHHIQRDDHGDAHFGELGGEIEVAFNVGGVHQV